MNNYIRALFAIGGVRALVMSRDLVHIDYHDHDVSQPRDLLVSERMRCAVIGALTFPITWPVSTFSDVRRLEIDIRNEMASASGETNASMIKKPKIKSMMDIVF